MIAIVLNTRWSDLLLWSVGVAMILAAGAAQSASPVPFFRDVERVGVLCAATAAPGFAGPPAAERVCRLAVEELAGLLRGAGLGQGPTVEALERNDERLVDPATLVVLLQAHAQIADAARTVALAVSLHRSRSDLGSPPFFLAPPEAVVLRGDSLEESVLRLPLRRLLEASVARPLQSNR